MTFDKKTLNEITDKALKSQLISVPYQAPLIEHEIDGSVIAQRPTDGYINATAMCQKAGKKFNDYMRLNSTNDFLEELSAEAGIPASALIQTLKGGNRQKLQGTWVHPRFAISLSIWLSPKFAVQVTKWVFDWLSGNPTGYMPEHVKRYMANRGKIPPTHFSMLNEIYLHLLAPMEQNGYLLPSKMIPDASTGRMFSKFLRDKGINPDKFPEYEHEFLDGQRKKVWARLYPNKYLPNFRSYFHDYWLPIHSLSYFKTRDPKALPHLNIIIATLPPPPPTDEE